MKRWRRGLVAIKCVQLRITPVWCRCIIARRSVVSASSRLLQLANETIESIRGRAVAASAVATDDEGSDVEIDGI